MDKYGLYEEMIREAYRPDPPLTLDKWSDQFRYLSNKSSAEPGRWRTDRTPYLREIMLRLSANDATPQVVLKKGAQVGGTEVGNNWIGYIIDHQPAPTLMVQPTIDMAKRNSRQRVDPLIEETPRLRDRVAKSKSRSSSNTMLMKDFTNGTLVMAGANSPAGLRSMPARNIFFDECSAYCADAEGEGSPISLAKARARTFSKRKFFLVSTPTVEGMCAIDAEFKASARHYYHVPCPHCSFYQQLVFAQLKWDDKDPKTTRYECINCEEPIYNHQKTPMLSAGRWICENPEDEITSSVGFHISALYSPVGWFAWSDVVDDWLKAQESVVKLKTFMNTVLGECWKDKTDVPDWRRLYERRSDYKINWLPPRVRFLTCGVDVQQDRLEMEIVGWCRNKVSYSIDYRVVMGNTANLNDGCWAQLDRLLVETWKGDEPNREMSVMMLAIDSGYNTQIVYSWARRHNPNRVVVVKGQDNLAQIHASPKAQDVNINLKKVRRGIRVWPVGVSVAKTELYGWLKQPMATSDESEPYGFSYFPQYDEEYFKMLTAEEMQVSVNKLGYKKTEWVKKRSRNEALDVRLYARAAASIIGIDRYNDEHWKRLESSPFSSKIEVSKQQDKLKSSENEYEEWL